MAMFMGKSTISNGSPMVFLWIPNHAPVVSLVSPASSSLRRLRRPGPAATGSHGAAVGAAATVAADAGGPWGRLGGEGAEELDNDLYIYICVCVCMYIIYIYIYICKFSYIYIYI